jgi:hypothetical protein
MSARLKMEAVFRLLIALVVGVLQAFYILIDGNKILAHDVGPLFQSEFFAAATCIGLTSLTLVIVFKRPNSLLLRAVFFGFLIGCIVFELAYFLSRFPILSPVSLSALLRPWLRIVPFAAISSLIGSTLFVVNNWKANQHPA